MINSNRNLISKEEEWLSVHHGIWSSSYCILPNICSLFNFTKLFQKQNLQIIELQVFKEVKGDRCCIFEGNNSKFLRRVQGQLYKPQSKNPISKWIKYTYSIYLVVKFDIDNIIGGIYHLECVRTIAMHVSKAIWNSPVRKEDHHLMCGFRAQRYEVPEHVSILVTKQKTVFTKLQSLCILYT